MADSAAFEKASETLEGTTNLDRLEARGTIRILLRQVGLDAKSVGAKELRVVVEKLLPRELTNRGISNPQDVIAVLQAALLSVPERDVGDSPADVFARLGGES